MLVNKPAGVPAHATVDNYVENMLAGLRYTLVSVPHVVTPFTSLGRKFLKKPSCMDNRTYKHENSVERVLRGRVELITGRVEFS